MSRVTVTDYYIKAFQKLESKGKDSWNWSAMLFTGAWLFYRKMYLYAFLLSVFEFCVLSFFGYIITGHDVSVVSKVFLGAKILERLFLGYYGNRLYYRTVKKRIADGYHLLDNYHPFSISSAVLSAIIFFSLDHLLLLFNIVVSIFVVAYALADWSVNKWHKRKQKSLNTEISEKNIRQYLTYGNRNHIPGQIVATLCVCVSLSSIMLVINEKVFEVKKQETSLIQTKDVSEKTTAKK